MTDIPESEYDLKQRWLSCKQSSAEIDSLLQPIKTFDVSWVARACLDALTRQDEIETAKKLVELGLSCELSEEHSNVGAALLACQDRLATYAELQGNSDAAQQEEEDDPWALEQDLEPTIAQPPSELPKLSDFLVQPLYPLALLLSSAGHVGTLRTLFKRHPFTPRQRLVIADALPEHLNPADILDLLPTSGQYSGHQPWRAEERNATTDGEAEVSPEELAQWYLRKVQRIDSSTGLLDGAFILVQHAAAKGVMGLDEVGEELGLLSKLVYGRSSIASTSAVAMEDYSLWSLARWRAAKPLEIISAYLADSTPLTIATDIKRLVLPYTYVLESKYERQGIQESDLPARLLREFIFGCADTRCDLLAAIFEASKPTLPSAQRIIKSDLELARVALACFYGSSALDAWTEMGKMFECLPALETSSSPIHQSLTAVIPATAVKPVDIYSIVSSFNPAETSAALDQLDIHLEAGETFARWNVPQPLIWFLQTGSTASGQKKLATRICRQATTTDFESEDEWNALMEDLVRLCADNGELKGALGMLEEKEVLQVFFNGLLSAGHFALAKSLFSPSSGARPVETGVQEELVLAASREFYDNADSGNLHTGNMKLAYDCLSAAPPTVKVKQEREFIEATSRLTSFNLFSRPGVPIAPIEIRMSQDRLSLIARLIDSNADARRHPQVILELVDKLGFRGDKLAEIRTLALIVSACAKAGEYERAAELCEEMVGKAEAVRKSSKGTDAQEVANMTWLACTRVGQSSSYQDSEKKLRLMGHALLLCPTEQVSDLLVSWRMVEDAAASDAQKSPTKTRESQFAVPATSPDRPNTPTSALAQRLTNDAMSLGNAARSYLRTPDGRPHSPMPAAALDSLLHGREGGVRDKLSVGFGRGVNWLIGAEEQ